MQYANATVVQVGKTLVELVGATWQTYSCVYPELLTEILPVLCVQANIAAYQGKAPLKLLVAQRPSVIGVEVCEGLRQHLLPRRLRPRYFCQQLLTGSARRGGVRI